MSSIKCPSCGLVNFASAATCKRCRNALSVQAPPADAQRLNAKQGSVQATPELDLTPPRTLGILLAILGAVLGAGGLYIMITFAGTPYFLVAGVGIAVSGALISTGKRTGMYVYFATFGVMFIWSLIETGGNIGTMMSRLFLAALIGLYLCTEKVRTRLR